MPLNNEVTLNDLYNCLQKIERRSFNMPHFTGRNVPISEIAAAIKKDAQFIRVGLQNQTLDFGYAQKLPNSNEYSYYCPDKQVYEKTGYFRVA